MTEPNNPPPFPPPLMPNQLPPISFGTRYQPGPLPGTVADGMVAIDIPCRKCAYNLRGLPAEGRCPECGASIGFSLMGDLLCYSDPSWVDTLRKGVKSILWGVVVTIVGAIGSITLDATLAAGVPPLVVVLVILLGYLLVLGGTWLLTSPDPSGLGEDKYGTSRRLIRITLLIGVVNQVLSVVERVEALPRAIGRVLSIVETLAAIAGLVGFIALLVYLGKLARRIPDPELTERAKFLGTAIGACYGIFLFFTLVTVLMASGSVAGADGALVGAACIIGVVALALLVLFFLYLRLLAQMAACFKQAADYARQTWAAQPRL